MRPQQQRLLAVIQRSIRPRAVSSKPETTTAVAPAAAVSDHWNKQVPKQLVVGVHRRRCPASPSSFSICCAPEPPAATTTIGPPPPTRRHCS